MGSKHEEGLRQRKSVERHFGLKNRLEQECGWVQEEGEGRLEAMNAHSHSEDWTLAGDGVAGKMKVGDPEEEWGEGRLSEGEGGLCWIDALVVRA
jgi:hypothetical protein